MIFLFLYLFNPIQDFLNNENSQPNIVFIMADDLGFGHLGSYGQKKIRTPNLDILAEEGLRFTQFYSGSTVCGPARSTLMTGYHTGHTSVRGNTGGIPLLDEDITIAEILKPKGYISGMFGKWGLGDFDTPGTPDKQGFDEYFGYLHQVHAHFYYHEYLWDNGKKFFLDGNEDGNRAQYTHDLITGRALDFIKRNSNKPFFLYVGYTIPHTELLVPEDSLNEYLGQWEEPNPYVGHHYASQPYPRSAFAGMVSRMDKDVGKIMSLLKDLGIDDNTVVFFTSDNGGQGFDGPDLEFFDGNGGLRGGKQDLYEGGVRVPLIARWPQMIKGGSVSDHVWAFWDVLPTIADIANASWPSEIDGFSMYPVLFGKYAKEHEYLYWEYGGEGNLKQAVRMGNWKYIKHRDGKSELYDLENDFSESNDLLEKHPGIVFLMEDIMTKGRTPRRKYDRKDMTFDYK